jgi:hypothetical protein
MFEFHLEPEIPLLTITRTGAWSVETVVAYEPLLRRELTLLNLSGRPRSCILDIRAAAVPSDAVAVALRAMVARFDLLHPDRTAIVSSSGVDRLDARYAANPEVRVFATMSCARGWIIGTAAVRRKPVVHDTPSDVEAEGLAVHVHGPSDVDIILTPAAALETAKRISDAAVDVILERARLDRVPEEPIV